MITDNEPRTIDTEVFPDLVPVRFIPNADTELMLTDVGGSYRVEVRMPWGLKYRIGVFGEETEARELYDDGVKKLKQGYRINFSAFEATIVENK